VFVCVCVYDFTVMTRVWMNVK